MNEARKKRKEKEKKISNGSLNFIESWKFQLLPGYLNEPRNNKAWIYAHIFIYIYIYIYQYKEAFK